MSEGRVSMLKVVESAELARISLRAAAAPRGRANFNLHPELADPVQRFLNAIEPGSYVRPHRHALAEGRWELFVILSGAVAVLVFDDEARVVERVELDLTGGALAVEIPPGVWHALVALKPGSVMFEFKPGPYSPLSDKDFAAWAPAEGDPAAAAWVERYCRAKVGDCLV